jgi:CubicO group peptidase (beta-lactamase class C family)
MFDADVLNNIKKVLRDGIENNETVGANLLIIKDGKEIFYHDDGFADREKGLPIKRDTIFRLYSMTKTFTSAAAMILLERGKIDLYDPVSMYLPGFKSQVVEENGRLVPVRREVNIKDLLSMTSGLVYDGESKAGRDTEKLFEEIDKRLLGDSPMSTEEIANRLGQCTLAFQPGESWQYGTSADVLGAVIEKASGMKFGDFLEKELLIPLNMKDTGFWLAEDKRSRLAKAYEKNADGSMTPYYGNYLGINNKMDRKPLFESGGAGLASTIDDCARFTRMLINGGILDGVRILKPMTVKYMISCTLNERQQEEFHNRFTELRGYSYGNLMRVMNDTGKAGIIASPGEYGWDGWLGVYFCNCPQIDLTFLYMMQRTNTGTTPLIRKLRNIVLSACDVK